MINWLFMCNAIVKFAQLKMREILIENQKFTLNDVLNYYKEAFPTSPLAKELSEYLIAYSDERKKEMKEDYRNGDFQGRRELTKDSSYSFSHNGTSYLF